MLVSPFVRARALPTRPLVAAALVAVLGLGAALPASGATRRSRRATRPAALPHVILPASASAWDQAVGLAARNGLGRAQGAVVAMDPRTGRVHALVNPALGMQRAFQPCSVFKIVVGIAGLSEGVITPDTTYRCRKGCWMWAGHGPIDLRRALAVSCNPYFEWVGEQLGYEKIQRYAHLLGLGEPSGINLTGETAGRVPAFVRPEAVGHLSSHAAGIETSAVQLAVLVSATVNGGVVLKPQVSGAAGLRAERAVAAAGRRRASTASPRASPARSTRAARARPSTPTWRWPARPAPARSSAGSRPTRRPTSPELVVVVFLKRGSGHGASAVAGRIFRELFGSGSGATAAGMP